MVLDTLLRSSSILPRSKTKRSDRGNRDDQSDCHSSRSGPDDNSHSDHVVGSMDRSVGSMELRLADSRLAAWACRLAERRPLLAGMCVQPQYL